MRILGFLLVLLLPIQAQALSCMRPSATRTYLEVNAAPETFVVVEGRLTLNTSKLPKKGTGKLNSSGATRIAARLRGKSMSASGFNVPFDQKVTLEVVCLGPWCGSAQNGEQVLAFLKREGPQYMLALNPCGGHVFSNPKPAMLKDVQRCYQGGACKN